MNEQDDDLVRFEKTAREIIQAMQNPVSNSGSNNVAKIYINAGGVGIWICVTCCSMMLSACLVGSIIGTSWLSSEVSHINHDLKDRKDENDSMKSYLAAIYVKDPELKPKEEKDNGNRPNHHPDSASTP